MVIGELALWEKTGGRSGHYRRAGSDLADLHLDVGALPGDTPEPGSAADAQAGDVSFPVTNVVES